MSVNLNNIELINGRADFDFFLEYNRLYRDDDTNDDPYFGRNISSNYHDINSLSRLPNIEKASVIISINIQSLQSKYEQLVLKLSDLEKGGVCIDVIVLQETWDIC
jgi:hypothetical protein